jgi:hypothetical protein
MKYSQPHAGSIYPPGIPARFTGIIRVTIRPARILAAPLVGYDWMVSGENMETPEDNIRGSPRLNRAVAPPWVPARCSRPPVSLRREGRGARRERCSEGEALGERGARRAQGMGPGQPRPSVRSAIASRRRGNLRDGGRVEEGGRAEGPAPLLKTSFPAPRREAPELATQCGGRGPRGGG